jgi:hypothetical protein
MLGSFGKTHRLLSPTQAFGIFCSSKIRHAFSSSKEAHFPRLRLVGDAVCNHDSITFEATCARDVECAEYRVALCGAGRGPRALLLLAVFETQVLPYTKQDDFLIEMSSFEKLQCPPPPWPPPCPPNPPPREDPPWYPPPADRWFKAGGQISRALAVSSS